MADSGAMTSPSDAPAGATPQPAVEPPRPKPAPPAQQPRPDSRTRVLALVGVALCGLALAAVARRALSEAWVAQATEASIAKAITLSPGNPVGQRQRAALAAGASGDLADAVPPLRAALSAAPRDVPTMLDLALALEASSDAAAAEQTLLVAADIDPGFLPRWSLANFYLRQNREADYWHWTRSALEADPSQTATAMDLSWRAFGDGDFILSQGVPDLPAVNRAYFEYLVDTQRLGSMLTLWPRVEPALTPSDLPNVSLYLDRLLLADEVSLAVDVWNGLVARGFIGLEQISLDHGPYLTNGDFTELISGLGFDWKVPPAEGVTRVQATGATPGEIAALEIRLSGAQPEYTPLLLQIAPIQPGRRYVMVYEYATQQLPPETGVGWLVRDARTEQIIAEPLSLENAEDFWYETSFTFDAPEDVSLLQLELKYQRVPGTTRQRGRFVMRNLRLEPAEESLGEDAGGAV